MSDERHRRLGRRLDAYIERRSQHEADLERALGQIALAGEGVDPLPWWQAEGRHRSWLAHRRPPIGPPSVTVVVPVYGAPEELRACLWALARHTTYPGEVLIIDDASVDLRIEGVLEEAAGLEGVRLLRNFQNSGFTATVNRGLRACGGDVVLLNSDTEVGPRWLEQLVDAAYADPRTGTVTPVSDNAGAFSVPAIDTANRLPPHLGVDDVARLIAAAADGQRLDVPTGNGFCLYIKRAVLDDVGELDAEAFPRGYGEENDFCMRASSQGWRHVIDGRTFVHHERESSFGAAKRDLSLAARQRLDERHPDYTRRVRAFIADPAVARMRERAGKALQSTEQWTGAGLPRLLFVIHEGGGGAVATNRDLMRALGREFECFAFTSDRYTLRLLGPAGDLIEEWPLERPIVFTDFTRSDYRRALASALERCRPELMHVRHLFKHTLDAPRMASARGLPIVMSFHDHYFVCPTIHLLDESGRYCGGVCTPGHGTCPTLRAGKLPTLKHAYVHEWREEMDTALEGVDTFVTTSAHTRGVHLRMLPVTRDRTFALIEHGRDLSQSAGRGEPPVPGGPVRILVPGNLDRHKGAALLEAMTEFDTEGRLELHFLGQVPARWEHLGVMHGAYERDELADRAAAIRPAFVGVFSIVAETYSHAVTEAWAAGIPVLATDLGAPAERLRAHGGGFLIPHDQPEDALAAVLRAADDTDGYAEEAARATLDGIPDVAEMTRRYADVYRGALDRRRIVAAPQRAVADPLRRGIWRATAIAASPTALEDVRALRPYRHSGIAWKLRTTAGARCTKDADLALLYPPVIPTSDVPALLQDLEARALPLVLVRDDQVERLTPPETLRLLAAAAQLTVVADAARAGSSGEARALVLREVLDEELFLRGTAGVAPRSAPDDGRRTLRLAGFGSPDGEIATDVAPRLEASIGRPVEVEPIDVDAGALRYPEYVRDLRERRPGWDIALVSQAGESAFLECAALGLPGVFAPGTPGVEDERTGLLADGIEASVEQLARISRDPSLGLRLSANAWDHVTAARLTRHGARDLLHGLGRVLDANPAMHFAPGSAPG